MATSKKREKRIARKRRVRAKVFGTSSCPRLSVFRSNRSLVLQLIDDEKGKTLVYLSNSGTKSKTKKTKTEQSFDLGKKMAQEAKAKKVEKVVFDRGGYIYHGRVRAVAEGAREGGLKF